MDVADSADRSEDVNRTMTKGWKDKERDCARGKGTEMVEEEKEGREWEIRREEVRVEKGAEEDMERGKRKEKERKGNRTHERVGWRFIGTRDLLIIT